MTSNPLASFSSEMGVRAALAAASRALERVSDTPRLDAELLMAHALGVSRDRLILAHLGDTVPDAFAALVQRRLSHEPIAYITGSRAFWTVELQVGPGVLIPRPDSETLIEAAVAHFADRLPARILDLGTGPGTLLLAALAEWPLAQGLGIDASHVALGYARANAERLGMAARTEFRLGNWASGVDERFDLILANPPYIATAEPLPPQVRDYEPAGALFAGEDGLDDYRAIVPNIPRLLASGGIAVFEIGWTQAEAIAALASQHGLRTIVKNDLAGRNRALVMS